jgi:hypothetical protein
MVADGLQSNRPAQRISKRRDYLDSPTAPRIRKGDQMSKIDDAADKAKNATDKAAQSAKDAAKATGEKMKNAGEKIKKEGR